MRKLINWPAKFKFFEKFITWWDKYILKIGVAFLLLFVPLYPKLPLIDILHTWVYIRLEDFLIAFLVFIFVIELLRKKTNIQSPLSLPILFYWLIGGVSLAHSIFILSPQTPHFFSHLALLHYLRRIEYMILFFIALSAVRSVKDVYHYVWVFIVMLVGVTAYGFGQKFLGFPAFLTMNEEFAKGIPLYLSSESRITSTFAGHYDLGAFLVFALAFLGSLFFGLRKWWARVFVLLASFGAYFLLLFTASRISFAVYLSTISLTLFLQKRKCLIIPVLLLSLFLMREVSGTSGRFGKTFRVQQVVYDVKTGKPIATLEEFAAPPTPTPSPLPTPTVSPRVAKKEEITPPVQLTPIPIIKEKGPTATPYEELPLGSGFLEIPLLEKLGSGPTPTPRPIKTTGLLIASESAHLATISGEFLVKNTIVYDISFTTRFQGQWPRAVEAFARNIFLGSGYSSISLATDNDYLRLLGETGIFGLLGFLGILFTFLLMVRQSLRKMRSSFSRSVLIGVGTGTFGLFANAFLIDVFEASKVAYVFWIMIGITTGLYMIEVRKKESFFKEAFEVLQESVTTIIIFVLVSIALFYNVITNYFTADDFTWLKWAATTRLEDLTEFFSVSGGFFYRPLIKSLFYIFHLFLGLKPHGYHIISFGVHFLTTSLVYLIVRLLSHNWFIAFLAGLLFLIHPIHAETILWVSGYSGLFAGLFYLGAFYSFLKWKKTNGSNKTYKISSLLFYLGSIFLFILALLSYEIAVSLPAVLLLYVVVYKDAINGITTKWLKKILPLVPYLLIFNIYLYLRNIVAQAHWLSGDYSYNFKNFLFNFFGNLGGYFGEMIAGFYFIGFYDSLRFYFRSEKIMSLMGLMSLIGLIFFGQRLVRKKKIVFDRLFVFSLGWFVITLLPVLGLGNIAERYLYLPSFGFVFLLSVTVDRLYKRFALNRVLRLGLISGVLGILSFYYWQMGGVKSTWREAGETTNRMLRALSTTYKEFPEGSTLYFVRLPLRIERAWVFPVGIEDGLWFIYRDETLKIMKGNDLNQALDYKEKGKNVYVFVYEEGDLKEAQRM